MDSMEMFAGEEIGNGLALTDQSQTSTAPTENAYDPTQEDEHAHVLGGARDFSMQQTHHDTSADHNDASLTSVVNDILGDAGLLVPGDVTDVSHDVDMGQPATDQAPLAGTPAQQPVYSSLLEHMSPALRESLATGRWKLGPPSADVPTPVARRTTSAPPAVTDVIDLTSDDAPAVQPVRAMSVKRLPQGHAQHPAPKRPRVDLSSLPQAHVVNLSHARVADRASPLSVPSPTPSLPDIGAYGANGVGSSDGAGGAGGVDASQTLAALKSAAELKLRQQEHQRRQLLREQRAQLQQHLQEQAMRATAAATEGGGGVSEAEMNARVLEAFCKQQARSAARRADLQARAELAMRPPLKRGETEVLILDDDSGDETPADTGAMENDAECLEYSTRIVGMQYFLGTVTPGEGVVLRRDPRNMHDRNAIRVINTRGEQVGHIPASNAAVVAPLCDSNVVRLEGFVGGPRLSSDWHPLTVQVFCAPDRSGEVLHALRSLPAECVASFTTSYARQQREALYKKQLQEAAAAAEWQRLVDGTSSQQQAQAAFDSLLMRPAAQRDFAAMRDAGVPEGLTTELLPYQRQGLAWLVDREHPAAAAPGRRVLFWEVDPARNMYVNSVTKMASAQAPEPVRGGILSDDMGLGKTLQVIALMLVPPSGEGFAEGPLAADPAYGRSTLVVCPVSVVGNWIEQIKAHVAEGKLSVYVYHGNERTTDGEALRRHDVVLTTYATLATEHKRHTGSGGSPLFNGKWLRVVLDEAHAIKSRQSRQSIAAAALVAERRWALSGTPIQNKLEDLYSLARFLRVDTVADYSFWNRYIGRPVKSSDAVGISHIQELLGSLCLRRTKETQIGGKMLLELPARNVYMQKLQFTDEEAQVYRAMESEGRLIFNSYLRAGTALRNYAHVLDLIMRLRQICDHPALCTARPPTEAEIERARAQGVDYTDENVQRLVRLLRDSEGENCVLCYEPLSTPVITPCGHIFDRHCVTQALSISATCPYCRTEVTPSQLIEAPPEEPAAPSGGEAGEKGPFKSSTKVDALLRCLEVARAKDASVKSVVFSQWTSMLHLLEEPLRAAGFGFTVLEGSMTREKRDAAIESFTSNPDISVFLVSLKCGGVGLNLVRASQVFMMDPWWNPATEDQAIDRVHRLGQTRPVHVFRFIVEGTIEERLLDLQSKKRELVADTLGAEQSRNRLQEMRLDDLRRLFGSDRPAHGNGDASGAGPSETRAQPE